MKLFSIIICTYNRIDFLPKALAGLSKQILSANEFEIILVNNNSPDSTDSFCKNFIEQHPDLDIQYEIEYNQGLSYARNKGIELANGEFLIFLDDDAIPIPEYLSHLKTFFNTYPDAIACGGRIYPLFESKRPKWMSSFLLPLTSSIDLGNKVKLFSLNQYPIGANMAFRKDVFQKYGLFDVNLGRRGNNLEGSEEKAIFLQLYKNKGAVYYVPDAIVHHAVPDKRLTYDFFKRQAQGIGYSERIRALSISKIEYTKSIVKELLKWGASFWLCIFYVATFHYQAGWKLLVFRWLVSSKLFRK